MVARLEALVDDMIEVLRTQRRAMAKLDVEALLDANARTTALLGDLEHILAETEAPPPALRSKVFAVSIEAEATSLLVQDALAVIRGLMGITDAPRVYDARGMMQDRDRRPIARSV